MFSAVLRRTRGYLLPLVVFSATAGAAPAPEQGFPLLRTYTRAEYQAQSDFWSPVVSRRTGLLYFGSHLGLIEFDGRNWRPLVGTMSYNRALAEGPQGELFVADEDALGFFSPPDTGTAKWTSLTDLVPAALRPLGLVRSVRSWGGAIWFCSDRAVLRWREGRFDTWPFAAPATARLFAVGDELLLHRAGEGLFVFDGAGFSPAPRPDPRLKDDLLLHAAPVPGGTLLGLQKGGLLLRDRTGALAPWPHEAGDRLTGGLHLAATLRDGAQALVTRTGELLILSSEGRLLAHHTRQNGLPPADILGMAEDRAGHLWLGTNNGPAHLAWRAGVTVFDARNGLGEARTRNIVRHAGELHVLNADGLHRLAPAAQTGEPARFVRDPRADAIDHPQLLLSHATGLLIVSRDGVQRLTATGVETLLAPAGGARTVIASRTQPERLFIGLTTRVLTGTLTDGGWHEDGLLPDIDTELLDLVEETDGTLWVSTVSKGVFRVPRPADGDWRRAAPRHYTVADGLPENHGAIYAWSSSLGAHLDTAQGMYRHNRTADRLEFDAPLVAFETRKVVINPLAGGAPGELWANGILTTREIPYPLMRLLAGPAGGFTLQRAPRDVFAAIAPGGAYRIRPEPDKGVVWARVEKALLRVETSAYGNPPPLPAPLIRQVMAGGADHRVPFAGRPADDPLKLAFSREPMTITYASGAFLEPGLERFQTRLIGFNAVWSAPTAKTEAIFTNLEGGPFRFQVRTLGPAGETSEPVELVFAVRPPWFRRTEAYAGYSLLLLGLIAGYIRWRLGAVRREQHRLEKLVTARTAELAVARDEAETANRAKSTFLAHMSHELRTPLNGVIGYAQVLLNDRSLTGPQRERANIVHTSGTHLLRLINEVLDFSKIEAGRIERSDAPFHPRQLLDELAALHEPAAATKGLAFTVRRPESLPEFVTGDAQKLRQVLDNLLSNAVKFTRQGRVSLTVEPAGASAWTFSISDTGVGLSAAELAGLFQPFAQAAGRPAGEAGTGLGLVITRRLVELLGGELHVESTPGRGSRFFFTLNLPAAAAPDGSSHPPFPAGRYEGPARRVLIVDDVKLNRDLLADLLAPLGFVSETHVSAEEALAALEGSPPPDLAIIDVKLPGIDGLELTRRLRARPETAHLPIVLSSASVLTFDADAAARAGSNEFLPKPFAVSELVGLLTRLLGLDWTTSSAPAGAASGAKLDPALAQTLLSAADAGDVTALRAALAAARTQQPSASSFLDQLEKLAAGYQLERIRQLLRSIHP